MTANPIADALVAVFGSGPFLSEYTTDHIGKVLAKLLGQELNEADVLAALRAADFAHPRPGKGKHLLKWRFTRAEGATSAPVKRGRQKPREEKPLALSLRLKAS